MTLIQNDETLRKYMPNVFATAKGETSLYDKLSPWLEASEQWFVQNITGEDSLDEIARMQNIPFMLSAQIVVADALMNAIPSLDLVLTPNGFGIVSNNNVAPASKERVERLIASLLEGRDKNIELLIPLLASQTQAWKQSAQYAWFTATLFPNLDITTLCDIKEHRWQKYCSLRQKIIAIEQSLAEEYFSHELINKLRGMCGQFGLLSLTHAPIVKGIRWQITSLLKGESLDRRSMIDLVNYIRTNPDDFPEWVNSQTAKLFAPPIFENKLMANGYWF